MVASKRRSASTWAVSRRDEGKEPRNARNRKDDEFRSTEVNTSTAAKGISQDGARPAICDFPP